MAKKSVLICEYCGKPIDQEDRFVHEIDRDGLEITHEGDYHQECFINSMIKDLEELGFEVIRPRSEINHNLSDELPFGQQTLPISPDMVKTGLDLMDGFFKNLPDPDQDRRVGKSNFALNMANHLKAIEGLSPEERKTYEEKKKEAMSKIAPDFLGDDPEKMDVGTITPEPKKVVKSETQNGKRKKETKSTGSKKK